VSDPGAPDPPEAGFTFGPSALATPANAVTVARLLAAPVFVAMIMVVGGHVVQLRRSGGILAASDGLDGYMARRQGTTRSGAFLDPLADKAWCWAPWSPGRAKGTCRGCR
jgi:CDP-diacylglycerol--glycerol-3-phosphate 3-phosphatidyltransferase